LDSQISLLNERFYFSFWKEDKEKQKLIKQRNALDEKRKNTRLKRKGTI
jgi:hypothetical protein